MFANTAERLCEDIGYSKYQKRLSGKVVDKYVLKKHQEFGHLMSIRWDSHLKNGNQRQYNDVQLYAFKLRQTSLHTFRFTFPEIWLLHGGHRSLFDQLSLVAEYMLTVIPNTHVLAVLRSIQHKIGGLDAVRL